MAAFPLAVPVHVGPRSPEMHGLPPTLALWASLTQLLHSLLPMFKAQISQEFNTKMEFLNLFSPALALRLANRKCNI